MIAETLRKYPVATNLLRECTKDYVIPNTDVIIEKGTPVLIPIREIHHEPDYYPEPEKFIPERFNDENKTKIPPYAFLPFGEGPRICLGT